MLESRVARIVQLEQISLYRTCLIRNVHQNTDIEGQLKRADTHLR